MPTEAYASMAWPMGTETPLIVRTVVETVGVVNVRPLGLGVIVGVPVIVSLVPSFSYIEISTRRVSAANFSPVCGARLIYSLGREKCIPSFGIEN